MYFMCVMQCNVLQRKAMQCTVTECNVVKATISIYFLYVCTYVRTHCMYVRRYQMQCDVMQGDAMQRNVMYV